ncbi:uncharacterized protein LOC62_05G007197 [Vanrija pseudolonga]|uniref:Luciferase domain-containing protein n=1 Tax=Vanrija pseudolonga TaxID=143232 RepID=A0AAF0YC02_9TREE|nr:hypothetical protein LOC62_05G007197 [Vanrija pseudolonga]
MSLVSSLGLQPRLEGLVDAVARGYDAHPVLALALLPLVLVPLLLAARAYRGYLALGPGGLPNNVFGWALQASLRPFARETKSTAVYEADGTVWAFPSHGRVSFLWRADLPARSPPVPPEVPDYIAPQRQVTQVGKAPIIAAMDEFLASLADANEGLLAIKGSKLEDHASSALWILDTDAETEAANDRPLADYLQPLVKGELVHVHSEGSSHITLSLADAAKAIGAGWAQRHPLSGVKAFGLPVSYVMLYAPRDKDELEVWKNFVRASVEFTTADWAPKYQPLNLAWSR